jgi:hypothetical protein
MDLISFMSKSCHYAQEHIHDPDAWSQNVNKRKYLFQCTSYQVACFLAQNTFLGQDGVECDIVLDKLAEPGVKSEEQWEKIITDIVGDLGGWVI